MQIIKGPTPIVQSNFAIVTAGTFDGVHLGHRKIIERLVQLAQEYKGESTLITYDPHPRLVLQPEYKELRYLTTLDEKIALLESTGLQRLVIIPFTIEFSELSSLDFINQILINKLQTKKLVIGYDHRFGKNREGGFDYLKANGQNFGFTVEEISRADIDDAGISSSRIRKALLEGNVAIAAKTLGRNYSLSGTVVEGRQLGRTLGYPTANIVVDDPFKLIPADGVYANYTYLPDGRKVPSIMSIGTNPTVNGENRTVESHLLDFNETLYAQKITVEFTHHLRGMVKFNGLEELKAAMANDEQKARALFELAGK